jgi:phytoene synthase
MANTFYESSFSAIKEIPFNFRFAILVARRVYRKIGDIILTKNNISTYNACGKIYVGNFEKTQQTFLSVFDLLKLLLLKQKNNFIDEERLLINEEIDLNERI